MKVHRFEAPGKVTLDDVPTDPPASMTKRDARDEFDELSGELFELQDLMWGARTHSVLMILQGRDAAGKDGTVKHLSGALNPRGVTVTSFAAPTVEERQHDFLWRVHQHAPRSGEVAIFNRSHYEDVLVARVKSLVPRAVWKERYEQINAFERTLAEAGCILLKFFLHITKEEQKERLLEREKDPNDAWKLNVEDWKDRERWDEYTEAYEDAIGKCAAKEAPWIVVPANAKWYRNLLVARTVADAMRPHRAAWRQALDEEGKLVRRDLKAWRAQHGED